MIEPATQEEEADTFTTPWRMQQDGLNGGWMLYTDAPHGKRISYVGHLRSLKVATYLVSLHNVYLEGKRS